MHLESVQWPHKNCSERTKLDAPTASGLQIPVLAGYGYTQQLASSFP